MIAVRPHPVLTGSPFQSYVYAYPHKTAYRPLAPRVPIADIWSAEPNAGLQLYIHIPFCSMRCGFCNLFTTPNPKNAAVATYLDAIERQGIAVREAIQEADFARVAVGGGTPTFLDEDGLNAVFDIAEATVGADLRRALVGIEVSPDTLTADKLALLESRGVNRVSIGVQSFFESETAGCGRPQPRRQLDAALGLIRAGRASLNIDLIYGLPGQSRSSWAESLRLALAYRPEELYLYPLYIRPLTGLGRSRSSESDVRLDLYRAGRDLLLEAGYEQVSMRMFRRADAASADGPAYCCQEDGMIGLGCGARSYSRRLHYSLDYAVGAKTIREILADYAARDREQFALADHGYKLNDDERRRRDLIQSVLQVEGLSIARYTARFGTDPAADFPDLVEFADLGLLDLADSHWVPTPLGLERSDAMGPWFFSEPVRRLIAEYTPR